ncbi:hypothetical protein B7W85_17675 [Allorhizobium ampelinum]|nr:hypothetical protein B7W85_17675 [Allorhizobium ampelinum]
MKASVSLRHEPLWLFSCRALLLQIVRWAKKCGDKLGGAEGICESFRSCSVRFQRGFGEKKGGLMKVSFDMKVVLSVGFWCVVAGVAGVFMS